MIIRSNGEAVLQPGDRLHLRIRPDGQAGLDQGSIVAVDARICWELERELRPGSGHWIGRLVHGPPTPCDRAEISAEATVAGIPPAPEDGELAEPLDDIAERAETLLEDARQGYCRCHADEACGFHLACGLGMEPDSYEVRYRAYLLAADAHEAALRKFRAGWPGGPAELPREGGGR